MLIRYTSFWSTLHYKHDNVHNFIFFFNFLSWFPPKNAMNMKFVF